MDTNIELCRKFLVKFCSIQNEELEKLGYKPIFTDEDIINIATTLTIEQTIYVVSKMTEMILYDLSNDMVPEDDHIMPWCILTDGDCDKCKYGEKHGLCSEKESDYRKLTNQNIDRIFILGDISKRILKLIYNYNTKGSIL
jgi:hypothetical protein